MRGEHEPRGTRHEEDDHEGEGEDENRRDEARSNKQTRAGWRLRAMTLGGMLHAACCCVFGYMPHELQWQQQRKHPTTDSHDEDKTAIASTLVRCVWL